MKEHSRRCQDPKTGLRAAGQSRVTGHSPALLLAICNGCLHQLLVDRHLRCSQDQGWVGGGILGLVLFNG